MMEAPPTPGTHPSIAAEQAIQVSWGHAGDVQPSRIVADLGLWGDGPAWFVDFQGICRVVSGGGVFDSPVACPITDETVVVDATNGDWLETHW